MLMLMLAVNMIPADQFQTYLCVTHRYEQSNFPVNTKLKQLFVNRNKNMAASRFCTPQLKAEIESKNH